MPRRTLWSGTCPAWQPVLSAWQCAACRACCARAIHQRARVRVQAGHILHGMRNSRGGSQGD